jgi:hypothetical protein
MIRFLLILWILSVVVTIYTQLRYAKANYPNTLHWKYVLFLPAFISGAVGIAVFSHKELTWQGLLVATVLTGLASGFGFTFLSPLNLQTRIPKRKEGDNKLPE